MPYNDGKTSNDILSQVASTLGYGSETEMHDSLSKYAGTEVKLDGEEYIIVKQSDILAIVK